MRIIPNVLLFLLPGLVLAQGPTVGPRAVRPSSTSPGAVTIYRDPATGVLMEVTRAGLTAPARIDFSVERNQSNYLYTQSVATATQMRAISTINTPTPPQSVIIGSGPQSGTWVLDPVDTSSPDNTGTVLVTGSGLRYKRQFSGPINAQWFVAGTPADYAPAFNQAIAAAATARIPCELPAGSFPIGPLTLISGVEVRGQPGGATRLVRNTIRGYALSGTVDNTTVSDLYIDCNSSALEGGYRVAGSRNTIRNVTVENGDATSITVSTRLSNATPAVIAADNLVENCVARYQKRYHEVGGTAPMLAGDNALRTVFRGCSVEDCNNAVSFDYYDSDNAPGTRFENCVARKSGALANATAFWCEGEQTDTDHTVYYQGCYAVNFVNGYGSSERAKPTIIDSRADSCRHAFINLNGQFAPYLKNVRVTGCGTGINAPTDGIIATTGAITLENVTVAASAPVQSFVNYQGGNGQTREPIRMLGCSFDVSVNLCEQNAGSLNISVDRCVFTGQVVIDNAPSAQVVIAGSTFQNAVLYAARSAPGSRVENCRFLGVDNSKVAITQALDNFNLLINNNSFSGYQQAVDANSVASVGIGNSEQNNTSPLPTPNSGDLQYFNGRTWTRLPAGANGQLLRMSGGLPTWSN